MGHSKEERAVSSGVQMSKKKALEGMLGLEAWSGKHTWVGGAELRLWLEGSSSSD
jgi:hypothetical protein